MPEHVRKMFEPPLNLGHEMVQIHNFQQRIRGLIQNRVVNLTIEISSL